MYKRQYLLYAIRWGDANRYKAVLTIPVKSENLFQSDYMKNYFFVYPDENDFGIRITADSVKTVSYTHLTLPTSDLV